MVLSPTLITKPNLMSKELIDNSVLQHFISLTNRRKRLSVDLKCWDHLMTTWHLLSEWKCKCMKCIWQQSVATLSSNGCWCDIFFSHFCWTQYKKKMRWILTSRLISADQVEQQSVVPEVDRDQTVLLHFNFVLKTMSSERKAAAQLQKNASALLQSRVRNNVTVFLCCWLKKKKNTL